MIRIAGFAAWRFINFFKYLLKPRYVFFSFRFMLFKRFFELFRPRGLTRCHSATPISAASTHARNRPDPFGNLPGRVAAPTNEFGIRPLGLASEGPGIKRLFGFIQPRTSSPPREALVQTRDRRPRIIGSTHRPPWRSEAKGPPSYICLRPTGTSDNRLPSVPKRGRTSGSPPATWRSTCSPRTIAGPGLPDTDLFGSAPARLAATACSEKVLSAKNALTFE